MGEYNDDDDDDDDIMSQYTARANLVVRQSITKIDTDVAVTDLPSVVRTILETNLFEKYGPPLMMTAAEEASPSSSIVTTHSCCRVASHVLYESIASSHDVPNKLNTVVISALHHAVLTNTTFRGVYYAFLMSHSLKGKKKSTNVGVSKNPIFSVIAHNNQAYVNRAANRTLSKEAFPVIYDKDTASAAPHWKLDQVVGTFISKREAIECCHQWVKKTRGTDSKRERGPKLARYYDTTLYSSQIKSPERSLESQLVRINAPVEYIVASHVMKNACTRFVTAAVKSRVDGEPTYASSHIERTTTTKKKKKPMVTTTTTKKKIKKMRKKTTKRTKKICHA